MAVCGRIPAVLLAVAIVGAVANAVPSSSSGLFPRLRALPEQGADATPRAAELVAETSSVSRERGRGRERRVRSDAPESGKQGRTHDACAARAFSPGHLAV